MTPHETSLASLTRPPVALSRRAGIAASRVDAVGSAE